MTIFKQFFWVTYLLISGVAVVGVVRYIATQRQFKLPIKVILYAVIIIFLGFSSYLYMTQQPFQVIIESATPIRVQEIQRKQIQKELLPMEEEPAIKHYLMSIEKDRPIRIGAPREIQIQFTDPLNPKSPHAVFQIVFENKGAQWAQDINIEWDIRDMGAQGRIITPPDEWARITGKKKETYSLGPRMGFLQIYGREIGAYAQKDPPNIEITINVTYKDIMGKQYLYYCKSKTIIEQSKDRRYFFEIEEVK